MFTHHLHWVRYPMLGSPRDLRIHLALYRPSCVVHMSPVPSGRRLEGKRTQSLLCASDTATQDDNPCTHSFKGFYVTHGCTSEKTQTRLPVYECPAEVRGSAQLLPWSKFLSAGVAILNVRLGNIHFDTGDLGKILQPFAAAFFPKVGKRSLIFEDIMYDLARSQQEHKRKIHKLAEQLKSRRVGLELYCMDSHLTYVVSAPL
jgi:hypothetical protein